MKGGASWSLHWSADYNEDVEGHVRLKVFLSVAACAVAWFVAVPRASQAERVWHFDQEAPGGPPGGFLLSSMRQPSSGRWTVERQGGQGFVAHHADPGAAGYALALASELTPVDAAVSARLRFSGTVRTGGLIWRAQDSQNFYALILDLVAREIALYRVTSGNRIRIDVEDDLELDPHGWHALKVVHEDAEIRVTLGGIGVFHERDRRDEHQSASLRVGLLAAGAADVWFDELRVESKKGRR